MPRLRFLDGCSMVGWRASRHPETIWQPRDFMRDYDYYGIGAALVHSATAVEYNLDYGNRRLLEEIADFPRLLPQWVVMPHHTHEMAPPDELVPEMLEVGVRAARVYPKTHNIPLGDQVSGPLLSALAERRIPLFVDVGELSIDQAASLCERFPELPVVLCGVNWGVDRQLEPALQRVENLLIETHSFQGHRAYERFVDAFGADRLIFGTGLPDCSPGAAVMMSVYEDIRDEDRAKIAGANLLRLLRAVEADVPLPFDEVPDVEPSPDDDPIVAAMREGRPLAEEFIFDAHGHIAHDGAMGIAKNTLPYNDADGLVGTMDRCGIDRCIASTWSGIRQGDPASNDIMLRGVERYPERLLAYGTVNPRYPEIAAGEMRRVFDTKRVVGYKPYPSAHQVPLPDSRHRPMLEWADRHGAPVLCHGGLSAARAVTPECLATVAPLYPNAKFLLAHTGSSWALAEALVPVARQSGNICAEITYTTITYNMVEYLVREMGRHRVLFGTDCVMRDAAPQLGWVAWAGIPLEDKRMVLGHNIA
ncbi:MAG: amidohydrolase family protein, partial [Armatimonadota bacterium]|nr:amidohydrolase family protein [Armatimonadota bacterium]